MPTYTYYTYTHIHLQIYVSRSEHGISAPRERRRRRRANRSHRGEFRKEPRGSTSAATQENGNIEKALWSLEHALRSHRG